MLARARRPADDDVARVAATDPRRHVELAVDDLGEVAEHVDDAVGAQAPPELVEVTHRQVAQSHVGRAVGVAQVHVRAEQRGQANVVVDRARDARDRDDDRPRDDAGEQRANDRGAARAGMPRQAHEAERDQQRQHRQHRVEHVEPRYVANGNDEDQPCERDAGDDKDRAALAGFAPRDAQDAAGEGS